MSAWVIVTNPVESFLAVWDAEDGRSLMFGSREDIDRFVADLQERAEAVWPTPAPRITVESLSRKETI